MIFKFTKEKETKGTFRYKADDDEGIAYIYISKDAINKLGDPEKIKVTVEKVK